MATLEVGVKGADLSKSSGVDATLMTKKDGCVSVSIFIISHEVGLQSCIYTSFQWDIKEAYCSAL